MKIKRKKTEIKEKKDNSKLKKEEIIEIPIENKQPRIARRRAKIEVQPKEKIKNSGNFNHKGMPGFRGGSAPSKNTRYAEINNFINSKMI